MTRILGRIDYGTPQPTKAAVPARRLVNSAERKRLAYGPPKTRKPRPDAAEVYAWLLDFAKRDARAPQLHEIDNRWGASGNIVLKQLVRDGLVVNEIGKHNWRVMRFPEHGTHTLTPKGFRAYRLIDHRGDWWRRGDRWEQRS